MIVKQILLLFSMIILAVTGLPHDLNYKKQNDNFEFHDSSAPFIDQDKAQSVLKALRSKEKLNLKPCSRRLSSGSSSDSDQLIKTSSHVVVIPFESLDSNRLDSQEHFAPNKNNIQYFDDGDSYKTFLQTKSTENEQESEPVTRAGENIVNYLKSPKKNKVSITSSYDPRNLSQQKSVDISPFRVSKSQHVSVEDAYDTLESLARASPGYDNEQREIIAHYPSVNNYKKKVHNPTKPFNHGQNMDSSLSVQENDENYDAITYALEKEMAEEDVRPGKGKKYNPQVFKNIAKLFSIYEQNNEEQESPTKARLVVNPGRNALKAQSLKKYDDTLEDTDSIQDDHNSVNNKLISNLRSKTQSLKHKNDNEESISQESNLTTESGETKTDLKSVPNNLKSTHDKNKVKFVIMNHKDYFNNQKDIKDTFEPNFSQSYITLKKQLHNSNSDSVKSYEDANSEQRSGEVSNYFSESEPDLSLGVSHELNQRQLSIENSNLSSSQPNNGLIVKVSPLIKDKKHSFNPELSSDQNLSQEVDENSENYYSTQRDSHPQNYVIEDLSESFKNKVQKSNSRHEINSPVSKVTVSLKGRKQLLNDNNLYLSSSQEEDSRKNRSSHKSHDEDDTSSLSDYQENEDNRVNGRYQYKVQVPAIRVKEEKHIVNDQVPNLKSSNQNLIQEVEENGQNYRSLSHDSHRQDYESNDLSESFENEVQRSNSRHQKNSPVSKVTASLKSKKILLNDDNTSRSSNQEKEDSSQYRRSSHKSHDNDNESNLSDYQENEEKQVNGRYQNKVQVPEVKVKEKKHSVNDKISYNKSLNQEAELNFDNGIENSSEKEQKKRIYPISHHKSQPEDNHSSSHESQNQDDSLSDNLNESGENIYNHLESGSQDSQVTTVLKNSNLKSKYEVKESPQYHSTLTDTNDNTPNVDISFDNNSGLRNGYLESIKDTTCRDRLDLSTDYAQSNEALSNDELEQNTEIELRIGNNEQLDEDESQNDDGECIKDKIKLSKNVILNSASRRYFNNYLEEDHQYQEDEEEKADEEDETEETEASEEPVERDVEGSEQQNSESRNSLFDPSIGKGVREFSESRTSLSESYRLVCYACSTLSDPTCWAPDGKTTVKYCQKGHDSCIQRTYEGKDTLIMVRDCAVSCEGETVPGLSLKYKTCEVCHSDLCNSAYTALNSLNLMVMLSVITFVKYVF